MRDGTSVTGKIGEMIGEGGAEVGEEAEGGAEEVAGEDEKGSIQRVEKLKNLPSQKKVRIEIDAQRSPKKVN